MSQKELRKVQILELLEQGHVTAQEAAERLGMTARYLRRLRRRYREQGASGIAHASRGQPAPNRTDPETCQRILKLVETRFAEFNDTHLQEVLEDREGLQIGRETLRRLLRSNGYRAKRKRKPPPHRQRRPRKACRGQMVQWDGSHHRWIGSDGPTWTLMAAVDDADNRLVAAVFTEYEGSVPYLRLLDQMLRRHGIPVCLYQDRHGALSRNDGHWTLEEQLANRQSPTQVGRALEELQIQPIFAGSPQAKGRIERFFGVAQDRLIAELAAAGIQTLDEANEYLQKVWMPSYNRRFGRRPAQQDSAYRSLRGVDRPKILSLCYARTVAHDNTVTLGDLVLQIPPGPRRRSWAKARVEVRQHLDGAWSIYYQDQRIAHYSSTPLGEPERVLLKNAGSRLARIRSGLQVYFLPKDFALPSQPLEPL